MFCQRETLLKEVSDHAYKLLILLTLIIRKRSSQMRVDPKVNSLSNIVYCGTVSAHIISVQQINLSILTTYNGACGTGMSNICETPKIKISRFKLFNILW